MFYDQMIQSENSDMVRDLWLPYRETVTAYVRSRVEDWFRRDRLAACGKLRMDGFSLKQVIADAERKPVIAVWGAGRCNDLDLEALAGIAHVVLIDRETEWIEHAKEKYGFCDEQCTCLNIEFWDISEEEERYFETLLAGGADDDHMAAYLRQIADSGRLQNQDLVADVFDFSVCLGVASQLNARFAALLHIYKQDQGQCPETEAVLRQMNAKATDSLLNAMKETTGKAIICANELCSAPEDQKAFLLAAADDWSERWQEQTVTGIHMSVAEQSFVSGSREFLQGMECFMRNGDFFLNHRCGMVWPFAQNRCFLMDVMTVSVNKINQKRQNR